MNNTLQQIHDKLNELRKQIQVLRETSTYLDISLANSYMNSIWALERIAGELESPWISVKDRLPDHLETVWLTNGRQITLGCLIDFPNEEGWHWAGSNGIIYIQDGKIVAECESDDLDVTHWMPLPEPPKE